MPSRRTAQKTQKTDSRKDAVLAEALRLAAKTGWGPHLLPTPAARAVFPGGAAELAAWFSDWADRGMAEALTPKALADLRVRDRVTRGVRARLEFLTPHRAALGAALRFLSRQPGAVKLPGMVWRSAHLIWRAAGDTATDYNHYTKRLLLSGVIVSTTLHWLRDDSPGQRRTWAFLDRRIEDALKIGGLAAKFKKFG